MRPPTGFTPAKAEYLTPQRVESPLSSVPDISSVPSPTVFTLPRSGRLSARLKPTDTGREAVTWIMRTSAGREAKYSRV